MKAFTVDVAKCNGCYNCQIACHDEHVGNDWRPYSAPRPETGNLWLKLVETVRGTIPKVRIFYTATLCNHCENARCMEACPVSAVYRRDDGLVLIDPELCTGCGDCVSACPYGHIHMNEELRLAQKCTGCAHLLDNGFDTPRCVDACPTDALGFGEAEALQDFIVGADVMQPETACKPHVYYRNTPGYFIGGTLYDPVIKEVIIGAKCRLTLGGKTRRTETDAYGDFWFNDLPAGKYDLVIEHPGYETIVKSGIAAFTDSVNLGDMPINQKNA